MAKNSLKDTLKKVKFPYLIVIPEDDEGFIKQIKNLFQRQKFIGTVGGIIEKADLRSIREGSEAAIQAWQFDGAFSATDHEIVAWAGGTLTLMDGKSFSISGGNTSTMAALTYIYFDKAVSETVFQTTTTPADAVGTNKILIAVAENVAAGKKATFQVYGGIGGVGVLVTVDNLSVSQLSAIVADLGTITAGNITLDTSGYIKGGQTAYHTGTGFFLGYSSGAYKLSLGNPAGNFITWDGSILTIKGRMNLLAGDILFNSYDQEVNRDGVGTSYVEIGKYIDIYKGGTLRIKFDLKKSGAVGAISYGKIYRNGSPVGTEREAPETGPEWVTFSEDISGWSPGDQIQIYVKFSGPGTERKNIRNFRIYVAEWDGSVVEA